MTGGIKYKGPLNLFLEPLEGSILLNGVVEYTDSDGPKVHEGKFRLQMFGGIVLYDEADNSLGSVLPSQVQKATGERLGFTEDKNVTWDPQQRQLVVTN